MVNDLEHWKNAKVEVKLKPTRQAGYKFRVDYIDPDNAASFYGLGKVWDAKGFYDIIKAREFMAEYMEKYGAEKDGGSFESVPIVPKRRKSRS
ncbi:MAG: hypothetical protein MPK62_01905 [Alphaproteobacteria bacterium]|nr:hypothetical protein [Alphaproteobacteria bacterium]MDA8029888.1 hypothetical protein [Alphaproteobacteria bacterium]